MGLTESNQSKGSFWGPSRSKSTSQFLDGRSYEGKPRQASTLPARPVSNDRRSPPILLSSTKKDDSLFAVVRGRPPDRTKYRNRSLQRDPTTWREARTPRNGSSSQSVDRKKQRQSDSFLEFPSSPLNLVSNLRGRGSYLPIDKQERFSPSYYRPYSSFRNDFSPQDYTRSIYSVEENSSQRPSFRKSRRHDFACGRKEFKENIITSKEKQTQTFLSPTSFGQSSMDDKKEKFTRLSEAAEDSQEYAKLENNSERNAPRAEPLKETSCSVPATPNEIESDPYICLYYSNSINREPHKETTPERQKDTNSSLRVYSEACLYIPNEGVLLEKHPLGSPVNKRSQILIKVDSNDKIEVNKPESPKWNHDPIEVCSNVWFESRTKRGNKSNTSNEQSLQEIIPLNFVKLDSNSTHSNFSTSYKINNNLQKSWEPNEDNFNSETLDNENNINSNQREKLNHENINSINGLYEELESNSQTKDNSKTRGKEEDWTAIGMYNIAAGTNTNKPMNLLSLKSKSQTVPKLWLTEEYNDNEHAPLPEDKAIPIPLSTTSAKDALFQNREFMNVEKRSNSHLSESKSKPYSATELTFRKHNADDPTHFLSGLSSNILDSTKRTTSTADFNCDRPSNPLGSSDFPEKLRRRTIHNLDFGVFPVLRLPKSDSQPKLIDLLKKKTENDRNLMGDNECELSPPQHDPLLAETEVGSGLKYSPLDENILYIMEDGCNKPTFDFVKSRDWAAKLLKTFSYDLAQARNEFNKASINGSIISNTDAKFQAINSSTPKHKMTSEDCGHRESGDEFISNSLKQGPQTNEGFILKRHPDFKSLTFPKRKPPSQKNPKLKKYFSLKLKSPSLSKDSVGKFLYFKIFLLFIFHFVEIIANIMVNRAEYLTNKCLDRPIRHIFFKLFLFSKNNLLCMLFIN